MLSRETVHRAVRATNGKSNQRQSTQQWLRVRRAIARISGGFVVKRTDLLMKTSVDKGATKVWWILRMRKV